MTEGELRDILKLRSRADEEIRKFQRECGASIEKVHGAFLKAEEAGASARFMQYCAALKARDLLFTISFK